MYQILFTLVGPMMGMGGTVWNEDYINAFLNCIDLFDPSLDKTLKFAAYRPDDTDREFKWGAWNICLVKQLVELLQVHPTLEVVPSMPGGGQDCDLHCFLHDCFLLLACICLYCDSLHCLTSLWQVYHGTKWSMISTPMQSQTTSLTSHCSYVP